MKPYKSQVMAQNANENNDHCVVLGRQGVHNATGIHKCHHKGVNQFLDEI